jgi:hypothetical protein
MMALFPNPSREDIAQVKKATIVPNSTGQTRKRKPRSCLKVYKRGFSPDQNLSIALWPAKAIHVRRLSKKKGQTYCILL